MDVSEITNTKVCIVLPCEVANYNQESMVFIADLKMGDAMTVPMDPTVRLDWESFCLPAICVLGSKLYVFESYPKVTHPDNYPKGVIREKIQTDGKSVYTYHLSEGTSNLKLEKAMMHKESVGMNHIKDLPKATVTPDGKILVFSSRIDVDRSDEFVCDFELYDPDTRVWHNLPDLPVSGRLASDYIEGINENHIHVDAFTFMKKSIFFLRTNVGVFTLDLKSRKKVWKRSGLASIPSHRGDSFVVIGRDICVIPMSAYDIRVRGTCVSDGRKGAQYEDKEDIFAMVDYTFPELIKLGYGYDFGSCGVALLDHQDETNFSVCFLQVGINVETMHPELMLQVYYTDLPTCKKLLSEYRRKKVKEHPIWWKRKRETLMLPGTTQVTSLKIVVAEECQMLDLCSFSSISI